MGCSQILTGFNHTVLSVTNSLTLAGGSSSDLMCGCSGAAAEILKNNK